MMAVGEAKDAAFRITNRRGRRLRVGVKRLEGRVDLVVESPYPHP